MVRRSSVRLSYTPHYSIRHGTLYLQFHSWSIHRLSSLTTRPMTGPPDILPVHDDSVNFHLDKLYMTSKPACRCTVGTGAYFRCHRILLAVCRVALPTR